MNKTVNAPVNRALGSEVVFWQVIESIGGEYRNRTGVDGFAIRCVTTPPTRLCGVKTNASMFSRPGHLVGCHKNRLVLA